MVRKRNTVMKSTKSKSSHSSVIGTPMFTSTATTHCSGTAMSSLPVNVQTANQSTFISIRCKDDGTSDVEVTHSRFPLWFCELKAKAKRLLKRIVP